MQLQVGPRLDELHQVLKRIKAQAVVAVVREMGHEDADLDFKMMHKLQPKSNLYSMPRITIGLISNHYSNS